MPEDHLPRNTPDTIAANLKHLYLEIASIARGCGRDPGQIQLLAVSKTFPARAVRQAYEAGQTLFGENRVQEAEIKIPQAKAAGIQWHLIGHLQSNKARRAAELFDVIQSLDSEKIATKVGHHARELRKTIQVFVEVKIGRESQKEGAWPEQATALARVVESIPSLQLLGLMAIPPYDEDPEHSRPYFRQLRELLEEINRDRARPLTQLSMGMSHDYRIAIEEGATLLRIGTAIFGPRTG